MKGTIRYLVLSFSLLFLVSCKEQSFREGKYFAGGVYAKAEQLNHGKTIYTEYCLSCHGVNGDGNGMSRAGMSVPPRNFKLGLYKFGKVIAGELPHDEHLMEIIKKGLHGTAMLPWDMSEKQLRDVVQYIKTFAPEVWEGKDKKLGEPIFPTKDPYGLARKSAAIQKGKEVYHMVANCQSCHRAYATKDELNAMSMKYNDGPYEDYDPEIYKVKLQESDHGAKGLPPDFTWHHVRSANTVEGLYIRLVAGVGGASMPSWKDTIEDDEIWAVAHYVKSLMELKGKPGRTELMKRIKEQM